MANAVDREELRSRIGHLLRVKGVQALGAKFTNTATGAATVVHNATVLGGWPNKADLLDDAYVSIVGGTKSGETRQATSFSSSTGITCVAFSGNVDTTSECELWRFGLDADRINEAIDMALTDLGPDTAVLTQNTSIATESDRAEYPLPTSGLDAIYKVEMYSASPITGYAASNANTERPLWDTNANTRLARKITLTAGQVIWGYCIHLAVTGSPNVTLTAQLYTDSSGPSSTVSGTSATLASTLVAGASRYYVFKLTKPYKVTTSGTYYLALSSSQGALDASNYVAWQEDNTSSETTAMYRYNGSAWSAVSGSDLVFQVISDNKGDWFEWPAWAWTVLRDPSNPLLVFREQKQLVSEFGASATFGEGHPVRLLGYRRAALPTADTDTVEANPNFVLATAIVYLLAGMVGGPGVDPDDYARQVSIWQRKSEMMRGEQHTRMRLQPNTVWFDEVWR